MAFCEVCDLLGEETEAAVDENGDYKTVQTGYAADPVFLVCEDHTTATFDGPPPK